jgi:hypothetical protein
VTVVVENKPGASMMLGNMEVVRSPADGHTLLYTPSSAMAQVPHTLNNVQFDPFRDFTPISMGGLGPLVLVIHKVKLIRATVLQVLLQSKLCLLNYLKLCLLLLKKELDKLEVMHKLH